MREMNVIMKRRFINSFWTVECWEHCRKKTQTRNEGERERGGRERERESQSVSEREREGERERERSTGEKIFDHPCRPECTFNSQKTF